MQSFTRLALLAALASAASAACSFSTAGNVWNVQIFDQANCSKSGHYQEFHGTLDGDRCFNVASSLNDKVLSFVWTKQQSSTLGLRFYADAGCKNHIVALGTMGISKIQSGSTTGMNAISSFSI